MAGSMNEFQFTTTVKKFRENIECAAQAAVSSAVSAPLLESVLIQVGERGSSGNGAGAEEGKNNLLYGATNISITIRSLDRADEAWGSGEVALPAKKILAIARALPPSANVHVRVNTDTHTAHVRCGSYNAKIKGHDPSLMPALTGIKGDDESAAVIQVPATEALDGIRKTSFALSTEKSRYELGGVRMEINWPVDAGVDAPDVRLISTDGRRLSMFIFGESRILKRPSREGESPGSVVPIESVVATIPQRSVSAIASILSGNAGGDDEGGSEEMATMRIDNRRVQFEAGSVTITSTLLLDNFPDWRRVLPSREETRQLLRIDRQELIGAISRTSLMSHSLTNLIVMEVAENNPGRGEEGDEGNAVLRLSSSDKDSGGEADCLVTCRTGSWFEKISGEMRYNYRFILDFLKSADSKYIEIDVKIGDDFYKKVSVWRESQFSDGDKEKGDSYPANYRHAIMPLRGPSAPESGTGNGAGE